MLHNRSLLCFSSVVNFLLLVALLVGAVAQAGCFSFNYSSFTEEDKTNLILKNSYIVFGAIQVTPDVSTRALITNKSGRALFKRPFRLRKNTSFSSNFVLNIINTTNPGGEGLAFILTGHTDLPSNSQGQWLGLVNEATVSSPKIETVAVVFLTGGSNTENLNGSQVGLNLNGYSKKQESLYVDLSSGNDVKVRVRYDGEVLRVFVGEDTSSPALSDSLDFSIYLPHKVYVGFSASTGNYSQLNCVRSWEFSALDLDDHQMPQWIWIIVAALITLFIGFAFSLYWKWKYYVRKGGDPGFELQIQRLSTAPRKFRLKKLESATENFNSDNLLGRGGFGTVYKGVLVSREVAVKRFSRNSHEGKQDFMAEITTISNLHHRNLVKLLGWCHERDELLLVYEFMPNKSLDKLIFCNQNHGAETNPVTLNWERRHGVIYGVAQALDYLHNGCEKRVLHRDIKASNVMLDSEFNARLGDFGLARTINPSDQTHHSTKAIAGMPGYMAPEIFLIGRATVQTDVYAFGVLVLEVVCGRKPGRQSTQNNYNNSIVDWVWENYRGGSILDVVDLQLNGIFSKEQAECVLVLALACCHPNPYQRPSMRTVLRVLAGEVAPPVIPMDRPAFVWPPAMPPSLNEDLQDYTFSGDRNTPSSELIGR
ncbi:putative L-type lectin-domain containing receptor kinase S.5 [Vitis vinifera]|uniref:Putative L-type lectin-domain containing receptor kinase S.5 n=1 Tax=Vitis vinifera TaxID=29760 RepID=A0A438D5T4_VITVI|nr:putative L-type lectin-domain containing receptor kinase S.5 [Vitis vinifera]